LAFTHKEPFWKRSELTRFYYLLKPLIPRHIQILLRRYFFRKAISTHHSIWPIDPAAARKPAGWLGWPDDKQFALVLTHDVESQRGVDRCVQLADMEMDLGYRSSFNFLLQKYSTPEALRYYLIDNGFEVGIHGCHHDGKKFSSRDTFLKRAKVINEYVKEWDVSGFRAPSMQCNLDWIGDLDIDYDLSTFDTDPFEPNSTGVQTIYPYLVARGQGRSDFVELPYTLPQDSTLFVMLGMTDIDIWKRKLDWIAEKGGMALLNVHPDNMNFKSRREKLDEYPFELYSEFLEFIRENYANQFHHCLPRELAYFFSNKYGRSSNQQPDRIQL